MGRRRLCRIGPAVPGPGTIGEKRPFESGVRGMTTGHNENMKNHTATLFPHSYLPGAARDRILSSFDSITVCQPWYMESAAGTENNDGRVTIVRPPEDLKPPEDFRKFLSESRLWMSQNQGYTPLPTGEGEGATWEIRHALRQTGKEVREPVAEQALKWHLVLHLIRELEEDRNSADEMLLRVKAERSPLAEALGEVEPFTRSFRRPPPFRFTPFYRGAPPQPCIGRMVRPVRSLSSGRRQPCDDCPRRSELCSRDLRSRAPRTIQGGRSVILPDNTFPPVFR